MYWNQSYEEVKKEVEELCAFIQKHGEELRAKGPEACRQFLIDAGIIQPKNRRNVVISRKRTPKNQSPTD